MKKRRKFLIFAVSLLILLPQFIFADWSYYRTITLDTATIMDSFQVKVELTPTNFTYSHADSTGADLRFIDESGDTLDYWIEEWNVDDTSTVWVEVLDTGTTTFDMYYGNISASATSDGDATFQFFDDFGSPEPPEPSAYKFSVSSINHNDYGLSYPITYKFSVPSGSFNLVAYKKFTETSSWIPITEKTTDDFFNGIEAVRFDYSNNFALISIAFNSEYDDIYLKIENNTGEIVGAYLEITGYYDERECAVVCSIDEWDDCDTAYLCGYISNFGIGSRIACDECTSRNLWLSVGIVTQGRNNGGEPNWLDIQEKIDAGYIEPVSHSRTHADAQGNFDAESEVGGSKSDIINNLDLPFLNKKGTSEYVFAYLEPYGNSSSACRSKLGEHKYLCDRDITSDDTFASWNSSVGLYNRIGYSVRMGIDGTTNLSTLNSKFDNCYNIGKIYHLMWHSAQETTVGCWGVDYTTGSYFHQHLDYIKDKNDVWYVAFGHLYQYHYLKDRSIVSITPYYESGERELLDPDKWNVFQGDTPTVSSGLLDLASGGSASGIDSQTSFSSPIALHTRSYWSESSVLSTHYNSLRSYGSWSYSVCDMYSTAQNNECGIYSVDDGTLEGNSYISISDPTEYGEWVTRWYGEDNAFAYQDETELVHHTNEVPDDPMSVAFRAGSSTSDHVYVDWVFVRKCTDPEPIPTVGEETIQTIIDEPIPEAELTNVALFQNFPNPFNPQTIISYSLPKSCEVILNIYNIKGELVKTLVNEIQPAGNNSIVWNAENVSVSSGIYLYRITTGDFTASKKCVIMK